MEWFSVDRDGLAQLLDRRGKQFAVLELISNAWDEPGVTTVTVDLQPAGDGLADLKVTDDAPDGFLDLRDAWTLFAPSKKKGNAEIRGRFNVGEKLVLALCEEAEVVSTTGGVRFDSRGRRKLTKTTPAGSVFTARIRMDAADLAAADKAVRTLLPPERIATTYNGTPLQPRDPLVTFRSSLVSELDRGDGSLGRTHRTCEVRVFEPYAGETPTLYELGIPVVELDGDRFHVDVGQKVPLNVERDNVTPSYLRDIRVVVANHVPDLITAEDAGRPWVRSALADPRVLPPVVEKAMDELFGKKRVAFDPSDPEANKLATAQGYTVVPGGAFTKDQWRNIKRAETLPPAGKVTPSPKVIEDPTKPGPTPENEWTPGMARVASYAYRLGEELLGFVPDVQFRAEDNQFDAWWGARRLTFNVTRLGRRWFSQPDRQKVDALLIHEFAHHKATDHLDESFHHEVCRLAAKLRTAQAEL